VFETIYVKFYYDAKINYSIEQTKFIIYLQNIIYLQLISASHEIVLIILNTYKVYKKLKFCHYFFNYHTVIKNNK